MPCFCGKTEPHVDGIHSWGVPIPAVEERDVYRKALRLIYEGNYTAATNTIAKKALDFQPTWHKIKT